MSTGPSPIWNMGAPLGWFGSLTRRDGNPRAGLGPLPPTATVCRAIEGGIDVDCERGRLRGLTCGGGPEMAMARLSDTGGGIGGRWTLTSIFLGCACFGGCVTSDRGARADLATGAEGGGRQVELLAAGFERPKMGLDMADLAGAGIDRDKLDTGRGRLAAIFELEGFASTFEIDCVPVRLGGRAFSLEEDEAELDADNGR
jgi:hypothetical protein